MRRFRSWLRAWWNFLGDMWGVLVDAIGWLAYPVTTMLIFGVIWAFIWAPDYNDTPEKITVKCVEVAPDEWEAQT